MHAVFDLMSAIAEKLQISWSRLDVSVIDSLSL